MRHEGLQVGKKARTVQAGCDDLCLLGPSLKMLNDMIFEKDRWTESIWRELFQDKLDFNNLLLERHIDFKHFNTNILF